MENLNEVVSSNIVKYRKESGLTQLELAEKLNYSDKAVSKWERGDGLPDIDVLMRMSEIFGVTVNELCYIQPKQKRISKFRQHRYFFIAALSGLLVWFIATIVFAFLITFAPQLSHKWLCFIYAIPATGIVFLIFNCMWGKSIYNIIYTSIIVWGILLSICLSTIKYNTYWLLIIGLPFEILIVLWFIFKSYFFKKKQ